MNDSLVFLVLFASMLSCVLTIILLVVVVRSRDPDSAETWAPELVALKALAERLPSALSHEGRLGRDELRSILANHYQALETRLLGLGQAQVEQLSAIRREASDGRSAHEEALKRSSDGLAHSQTVRLGETNQAMKDLAERLQTSHLEARELQNASLLALGTRIQTLTESNERRQEAIRETINSNLNQLRTDNEAKLEQMRLTVDEKLQGTLEARLGESFKIVSDRLEHVHRGLGEMQVLATGVGDLKRVLTNVKSRGGWGEVQLGALLEDLLTPDQYGRNVRVRPDQGEVVEFAIRLPGRGGDAPVHLPIDAKFPHEDYERLLNTQEVGNADDVEKASVNLERVVRLQARTISEKYVHPPHSTDFAIMYLPTEGLYAEIIRRPGLVREIQGAHRVMVTGPTTLAAVLNSLQMGFRTLAIEKRSSQVWQVLGEAKEEFRKYGEVWDRLGKQLDTAKNTVVEAGRRTRAVERKLRDVETVQLSDATPSVMLGLEEDVA